MNFTKLGKTISYALRHHPEEFGLVLDEEGWVNLDDLLQSLQKQWGHVSLEDIQEVMAHSDKQRYELKDGKIRAYYGHSLKMKIKKEVVKPPVYLYHGTARRFLDAIMQEGLQPMNRQYVHLSQDIVTARQVGSRHDAHPIILKVKAMEAYEKGILFYQGHDQVWLSESLPPQYLMIENEK